MAADLLPAPTIAQVDPAPRRAIDRLAALGFRAVQLDATLPGLRLEDLGSSARRDLLATLRRHDILLCGFDLWQNPSRLADSSARDLAMAELASAIELAGHLGRVPLSVRLPEGEGEVEHLAAGLANHWGIEIADHRVADGSTDAPGPEAPIGIGIDPPACLALGRDPVAAVHAAGARLVSARVADLLRSGQRGPAGDEREGRLDVVAYRVALSGNGYRRPVVIDMRQWPDAAGGLEQTRRGVERGGPRLISRAAARGGGGSAAR